MVEKEDEMGENGDEEETGEMEPLGETSDDENEVEPDEGDVPPAPAPSSPVSEDLDGEEMGGVDDAEADTETEAEDNCDSATGEDVDEGGGLGLQGEAAAKSALQASAKAARRPVSFIVGPCRS